MVIPIIVVAALVFVVVPLVAQLGYGLPGYVEFYLHRGKYDRIVATVKGLGRATQYAIGIDDEKASRIDGLNVWWNRSTDGKYKIEIETVDAHHAGSYGYLYADVPPKLVGDDPFYPFDIPGGLPDVDQRVAPHWWVAHNGLN